MEELKRSLGALTKDYSDAQLRQLSREMDFVAEFLLDLYTLKHPRRRKENSASFDTVSSKL